MNNPDWLSNAQEGWQVINNPEILQLEIPSATGVGNARSVAKIFQLFADGFLINKTLLDYLIKNPVTIKEFDMISGLSLTRGYGFIFTESPTGSVSIGHSGYGGQQVKIDIENRVVFSYVTNGLGPDIGELHQRSKLLEFAIYDCIKKFKKTV